MSDSPPIHCPVTAVPVPDLSGFGPLLTRLASPAPLNADERFERGTLRRDGRLDLCKQDLGVVGCRAVTGALRDGNLVHSLLLGTNGIGDEGAELVAGLVRVRPLRTVYLGCNLIGPAGAGALAGAIATQPEVRALWLKRNPIGPEGAAALAGLLRGNTTLRTLDIVNTGIGEDGARAILRALAEDNATLEHLYLSGNALSPAVLPELLAVLERHPALRGLYLSVNALGDAGAAALAGAMKVCRLHTLGLASNGLSDTGLEALLVAVAGHQHLQSLDLGDAPSARVLGSLPNRAGPASRVALAALCRQPGPLTLLTLPRLEGPAVLAAPGLCIRITGQPDLGGPPTLPHHPDAADVRSLYR
jgi:Leucine Rich repeat